MSVSRRNFLFTTAAASALAALGKPTLTLAEEAAKGGTKWTKGVCRYCGTGCGVYKGTRDGKLVMVKGDKHNHNAGFLCLKGFLLPQILYDESRLTKPQIRNKKGVLEDASWDEALKLIVSKFKGSVKEHGADSVAFYGSGQAYTEETFLSNKLFRAGFRTNNVEGNPRLCMASAVGGYVTSFGKDEPMGNYEDIDHADVFLLAGSNTAEAHPILFQRIARRKQANDKVKVIVVDPRRTPTSRLADLHLQFKPGTDLALFNSMAHVLIKEGLIDTKFIKENLNFGKVKKVDQTWESYVAFLEDYSPEKVSKITDCPAEQIVEAARLFGAKGRASMSMWCMGLNQRSRGVWANNLCHNLHLITGKIGTPGNTPFSLTGQPNACGGVRDGGGLSHLLPYGRLAGKAPHRAIIEKLWDLEPGHLPSAPGKNAIDMFRGLDEGSIKCIYIMCTNPGQSLPNVTRYRNGMKSKDTFVVVADIYPTRTTELADVVLPAAAWSEKEGVFGCSERRYQLDEKVVEAPGEARADFQILLEIGKRAGFGAMLPYKTPADAWDEIRKLGKDTPYAFWGITRERLHKDHGVIWPCPEEGHPGTPRRYVKGVDPLVPADWPRRMKFYGRSDGKAIVWLRPMAPPAEVPDKEYPYYLTTGRVIEQWHTGTMTQKCKELKTANAETMLELHPDDAAALQVKAGNGVRVSSRRGSFVFRANVTDTCPAGTVFLNMHDPERMCNLVTIDAYDPGSKQPEFKICAVKLEKA